MEYLNLKVKSVSLLKIAKSFLTKIWESAENVKVFFFYNNLFTEQAVKNSSVFRPMWCSRRWISILKNGAWVAAGTLSTALLQSPHTALPQCALLFL